jgi:outer membrane beta-barrel protein
MAKNLNKKAPTGFPMQRLSQLQGKQPSQGKKSILAVATAISCGVAFSGAFFGTAAVSATPAKAQEIQLTGPLAGQPPVRKQRLYREGRFEIAPSWSFSLLDEYRRTMILGGRLQYNITEWFGIGAYGGYGLVSYGTDLADQIDTKAPKTVRNQTNIGQKFDSQTGKLTWMAIPQVTFSPFRGKLALFNSIFADTDLYFHAGVAFVGVEERKECSAADCSSNLRKVDFQRASRVAIAPSFGLGLTFYPSKIVSFGAEYRAYPFSWNRSGFDVAGGDGRPNAETGAVGSKAGGEFPDLRINSDDRTFKFNQMFTLFVGFSFPKAETSN